MAENRDINKAKPRDPDRKDRLKSALKANMAKRKAQARARSEEERRSDADKSRG